MVPATAVPGMKSDFSIWDWGQWRRRDLGGGSPLLSGRGIGECPLARIYSITNDIKPTTTAQALPSKSVFLVMNGTCTIQPLQRKNQLGNFFRHAQTLFEEILQNADRGLERRRSIRWGRGERPNIIGPPRGWRAVLRAN